MRRSTEFILSVFGNQYHSTTEIAREQSGVHRVATWPNLMIVPHWIPLSRPSLGIMELKIIGRKLTRMCELPLNTSIPWPVIEIHKSSLTLIMGVF
jgi:hypothetical protein